MDDNTRNLMLIGNLRERTEKKEQQWYAIDDYFKEFNNDSLKKFISGSHKYYYANEDRNDIPKLQEERSYCAKVNDGLILLFLSIYPDGTQTYSLCAQENIHKFVRDIVWYDDLQANLIELHNVVENSLPTLEDFLQSIIDA